LIIAEEDSPRSEKGRLADSILDKSVVKVNINKFKNNEKTVKTRPHQLPVVFFLNLPELNIIIIITSLSDPLKYPSPLDKHPGKVRIILYKVISKGE
jgi:hypothetical protein